MGIILMEKMSGYYRESDDYRAWVDEEGTGSIRILNRINFKIFVGIFKEILTEIRKVNPERQG
jgi:hypothetical protein